MKESISVTVATHRPRRPEAKVPPVADLLDRAADAFESGAITWGREYFNRPNGCRCALGAIGYALDPTDPDGNPLFSVLGGRAVEVLAEWLVDRLDAEERGYRGPYGDWVREPEEVVGEWNDRSERTAADVIEALRDAATAARGLAVAS